MTNQSTLETESHPNRVTYWLARILVPLVVGIIVSVGLVPAPKIGIVRLEGEIYDTLADFVVAQLDYARDDPGIAAVVLKVNSPGGGVTPSESMYFSLLSFRERKPLIVSVDTLAASGGYYVASAGQMIYAKPSSSVGNVGVVSFMPTASYVDEEMVTTGPLKLFGSSRTEYTREMELLKQGFLRAISAQRGDRLRVDEQTLSRGDIFVGIRAIELGLVDRLGTINDAVDEAARQAHVSHYQTVDLEAEVTGAAVATPAPPIGGPPENRLKRSPGTYYLYVDPAEVVR